MPPNSPEPVAEPLPHDAATLEAFLAAFESGTLPKHRWTHAAHILTGACYVHTLGEAQAIAHMRTRVRAYNLAVGGQNTDTSGYHETVTILWIKLLSAYHRETTAADPTLAHPESRPTFATRAVARFAPQRDILRRYYDYDIIASTEARRTWTSPNVGSLD
jgi:hypothetical protein